MRELALAYCPAAIHALAKLAGLATDQNGKPLPPARNENSRIAALNSLLDRAVGRPRQEVSVEDDGTSPLALHLLAATTISREIVERLERHPVIEHAEPAKAEEVAWSEAAHSAR